MVSNTRMIITKCTINVAKTRKIWIKQDWKDLIAIIYKVEGLTEKIHKTHQTVLAKRIKDRVRSIKGSGGLYV